MRQFEGHTRAEQMPESRPLDNVDSSSGVFRLHPLVVFDLPQF